MSNMNEFFENKKVKVLINNFLTENDIFHKCLKIVVTYFYKNKIMVLQLFLWNAIVDGK